jgi:MoxR-like ATPase
MTITARTEEEFVERLNAHLRPSTTIESFEHLYGREPQLEQIKETIYSPGRHVFIYGDRGVGKTSLARTAAFKFAPSTYEPVYVACGTDSTFIGIVSSIVDQQAK